MDTDAERLTTPGTEAEAEPTPESTSESTQGVGIPRWAWAVVVAMAVLVLWVTAPGAIRGALSSPASFLRVTAVVVTLIVFGRLVSRIVPNRPLAAGLRVAPVVAVSLWALLPYFSPSEVDEAFPTTVAADAAPAPPPTTATSIPVPTDAATTDPTAVPAPSSTTTTTTTTSTPAEPAQPELLRSGSFRGLTGHRGSGTAAIYDLADGSRLLRFEDLDAGPGPDLDVYLVPRSDATGLRDAIRIDDLTAERGNQNYGVPDGLDLTAGEWTVLIWCQAFSVEVANATLT